MAGKRGACTLARVSAFALSLGLFASLLSSPTQGQSSVTMTADEAKTYGLIDTVLEKMPMPPAAG